MQFPYVIVVISEGILIILTIELLLVGISGAIRSTIESTRFTFSEGALI